MNKKSLYALLCAMSCFAVVACDEDFDDVAAPQQYPQEESVTLPTVTATATGTIDLAAAEDYIDLFSLAPSAALPQDAVLANLRVEVVANPDDTTPLLINSLDGKFASADLQSAIEQLFGKKPVERTMYAVAYADVMVGDQASIVKSNSFEIKATPNAPIIEEAYYLVGAPNGWAADASVIKFNHSGADVYEDSKFTLAFDFPKGEDGANVDCWYKIVPQSQLDAWLNGATDWDGVLGCETDGDDSSPVSIKKGWSGALKIAAVEDAKVIIITIDMMESVLSYQTANFGAYLWTPGNHQSWTPATSVKLYSAGMDGKYSGFLNLDGEFKFTSEADWDHTNYGDGGNGTIDPAGGNMNAKKGFYYVNVDLISNTYSLVEANSWGIIGSGVANGWDSDTYQLTYDAEKGAWCVTDAVINGEIKFRANGGWDVNVGGSLSQLSVNGANINVEEGTYDVELYLINDEESRIVLTKK